jgi:hypothetical protein
VAPNIKGKTPVFSKALKTLSAARTLLPGGRQNVSINFTNGSSYGDHNNAVKEIARHHRRRNRLILGEVNTGSIPVAPHSKDAHVGIKNVKFDVEDEQENINSIGEIRYANFSYIITRPTTFLKEGRSIKKVSASKSVSSLSSCRQ